MSDSRRVAVEAILSVFHGLRKPKEALDAAPALSGQDRAFVMELLYGVVRYKETLDWALKRFLRKPSGLSPFTINNLRCGAYQILFMRVPEWAAVNEAVGLEKSRPSLANAVLRNIARSKENILSELKEMENACLDPSNPDSKKSQFISTLTSHPVWLVKRWIKRFGPAEALELAKANNQIPPLALRVNALRANRNAVIETLKGKGFEAEPTKYSPDGIVLKGFHNFRELMADMPELKSSVLAQDEAAQLVTHLLAPRPGERVLDACAAPGGKATHIAEMIRDKGEVVAIDISEKRLVSLRENIEAMGLKSIKALVGDAGKIKADDIGYFDKVLLDAPCTATGTIRRNPDVKYRHRPSDLTGEFHVKQVAMLKNVSTLLKPGGTLVYSTCSTEPEEGEGVIEEVIGRATQSPLKEHPDFYIIKDPLPFIGELLADGVFRTYPHRHGMDGFFGVRLGSHGS